MGASCLDQRAKSTSEKMVLNGLQRFFKLASAYANSIITVSEMNLYNNIVPLKYISKQLDLEYEWSPTAVQSPNCSENNYHCIFPHKRNFTKSEACDARDSHSQLVHHWQPSSSCSSWTESSPKLKESTLGFPTTKLHNLSNHGLCPVISQY